MTTELMFAILRMFPSIVEHDLVKFPWNCRIKSPPSIFFLGRFSSDPRRKSQLELRVIGCLVELHASFDGHSATVRNKPKKLAIRCPHTGFIFSWISMIHAHCIKDLSPSDEVPEAYQHHFSQITRNSIPITAAAHGSHSLPTTYLSQDCSIFQLWINFTSKPNNMCTTRISKSKECKHSWLVIEKPWDFDKGFSTCIVFHIVPYRTTALRCYPASEYDCPWQGQKWNYDFNRIRMIDDTKYHYGIPVGAIHSQRVNLIH